MTQEQRERLFRILGNIEGLTWGMDNQAVAEGFGGVAEDLATLLEEDGNDKNT